MYQDVYTTKYTTEETLKRPSEDDAERSSREVEE
jgi:hypothetical protein